MRKRTIILSLLFLMFSVVLFASSGTSPPIENIGIEMTIETNDDFSGYESPDINPINFEGVAISTGGNLEAVSYYFNSQDNAIINKVDRMLINSNYSANKLRQENRRIYDFIPLGTVNFGQIYNMEERCLFLYPNIASAYHI